MSAGAPMAKVFQYALLGCTRTIKTRINRFHYIVHVPRNVIIPEAQDAVAGTQAIVCAFHRALAFRLLRAETRQLR